MELYIYIAIAFMSFLTGVLVGEVAKAPDAQPERKKGRWLVVDAGHIDFLKCSICGDIFDWSRKNYCPNCGSYNGGEPND